MDASVLRTEGDIVARTEGDKIIARFAEDVVTGAKIIDNRGQGFGPVDDHMSRYRWWMILPSGIPC